MFVDSKSLQKLHSLKGLDCALIDAKAFAYLPTAFGISVVRQFIELGCVLIATFGENAENVHDLVDHEIESAMMTNDKAVNIVTTFHTDEPLDESLEFVIDHLLLEQRCDSLCLFESEAGEIGRALSFELKSQRISTNFTV